MIYETKGLSLEQVDELYGKVGKAWQSHTFVPTVSFQDVQDVSGGVDMRKSSLTDIENAAMRKVNSIASTSFHLLYVLTSSVEIGRTRGSYDREEVRAGYGRMSVEVRPEESSLPSNVHGET